MSTKDLKMIGEIALALGILLLIGGIIAATYYEVRGWLIHYKYYPYAEYSPSLIIVGVVLLVIGIAVSRRLEEEKKEVID